MTEVPYQDYCEQKQADCLNYVQDHLNFIITDELYFIYFMQDYQPTLNNYFFIFFWLFCYFVETQIIISNYQQLSNIFKLTEQMSYKMKVPQLKLQSMKSKKTKQQSSTRRSNQYYSPDYMSSHSRCYDKFYSPRGFYSNCMNLGSHYSQKLYGESKSTFPKGFYETINFPNEYLDYQPQFPVYKPCYTDRTYTETDYYTYHTYGDKDLKTTVWQKPQQDRNYAIYKNKNQMYAQTDRVTTNSKASQTEYFVPQVKQKQKYDAKQNVQKFQSMSQRHIKQVPNIKINQQQHEESSQIVSKMTEQKINIWEKQRDLLNIHQIPPSVSNQSFSNENISSNEHSGREQKKTFSEAILDQVLKKDKQKYKQQYNKDNRFSDVIVGQVTKTVHNKKQISETDQRIQKRHTYIKTQQNNQIHRNQHNQQANLRFYQNDTNINNEPQSNQIRKYNSYQAHNDINNIYRNQYRRQNQQQKNGQIRKIQVQQKPHKKQLSMRNIVNVIVSKSEEKDKNLRTSAAQTNDQNSFNSRNQTMQTEKSGNQIIFQKIVKNIIDDKEFRRRINQKTDELNMIKIQFEQDDLIRLEALINSKDAYLRYSKQYLQKLNKLIETGKTIKLQKMSTISSQQIPKIIVSPPFLSHPNFTEIPYKSPTSTSFHHSQQKLYERNKFIDPAPTSKPILNSPTFQGHSQIYHVAPHPQRIAQQVPFTRSPIRQVHQNTKK